MPEREIVQRLFELVMSAPDDQREAVLARECGADEEMKRRLRGMIAAVRGSWGDDATADIRPPAAGDTDDTFDGGVARRPRAVAAVAVSREGSGSRIGPYKLLQQIGEGGFGSVFMAEQEKPVARKVAFKIIKLGMDTGQVVARFEQERQALAMMDHPNIAKVLDAGATETGRPYFVMELCKGDPIVDYCDTNKLSIADRLDLLAQVCTAVQHAHSKGIIHRDIKPSNILVVTQDGRASAKIIDFGIAKATGTKLTDKTLFTEHRQLIGTPEYMSPEQAQGSLDIDTRTDVYALGVLLYELLTGGTPFSGKELRSASHADIERIIREVDPPKPSTRLSQSVATLASVAAQRRTEPRKLGAIIRGELDWIVMKAMEKDRQRRYETANGLAVDIRRYLTGEPVLAVPPSAGYKLKKFVRKHRVTATAAAAAAVALLIGVVAFAWQAQIARSQRDAAVLAQQAEADQRRIAEDERTKTAEQRDRAVAAETETKRRADELAKVSEFQAKMLSQIDATGAGVSLMADLRSQLDADLRKAGIAEPERAERGDVFGRELARVNATDAAAALIDRTILKPAIAAIGSQFADQPVVDASLRQTLANLYVRLGRNDDAEPLQMRALGTRRSLLGDLHPDTLTSINALGILRNAQGKLAEAETIFREVAEKRAKVLGSEHPDTLESIDNLGIVLQAAGRLDEAEPVQRGSLTARRRLLGPDNAATITSLNNLGITLQAQGKLDESRQCFVDASEAARRVMGEDDPNTITFVSNVGNILWSQGKTAEAEPYWTEALEKRRRVLGEDHPDTIAAISNMGSLRVAQNRKDEAVVFFRESLDKARRVMGDDHPSTLQMINNLGSTLLMMGKSAEAEPYLRSVLAARRRTIGNDHQDTLTSMNNLGAVLRDLGKLEEADAFGAEAIQGARRTMPSDHWLTAIFQSQHARTLAKMNRYADAEREALEAYPTMVKTFGASHDRSIGVAKVLVEVYTAWDKAEPGKGYETKAAEWGPRTAAAPAVSPAQADSKAKTEK